jgi:hypothetical protein
MYELFSFGGDELVCFISDVTDDFYDGCPEFFVAFNLDSNVGSVRFSELDSEDFLSEWDGDRERFLDVCNSVSMYRVFEDFYFVDSIYYTFNGCKFSKYNSCNFSSLHDGECSNVRFVMGGFDCCVSFVDDIDMSSMFESDNDCMFSCTYCGGYYPNSVCYHLGEGSDFYVTQLCKGCYERTLSTLGEIDYEDELVSLVI